MRPQLACAIELRRLFGQQALELRQPAIDRCEIRPLVVVAGHDRVERQRLPAQIAGGAERREGALECGAAARRLDEDPRPAEPVFEPRIALAHARRQSFDPIGQRLRAPLTGPFERVCANERTHSLPFARVAEEPKRFAHLAALDEQPGSTRACPAPLGARKPPAQLLQKELAKQRVVVISRLLAAAPIGEQMPAKKVVEQSRRLFASGERDGFGGRNRRRNRRQH